MGLPMVRGRHYCQIVALGKERVGARISQSLSPSSMISLVPPMDQTHPEARGQERSGDMVYGTEPPEEQSRAKKGEVWI